MLPGPPQDVVAIAALLDRAEALAACGADGAAKRAFVAILQADPTHRRALLGLGALAEAGGFVSAARTAFGQAVQCHPGDAVARLCLARRLGVDDPAAACAQYRAVLDLPGCAPTHLAEAHLGLARLLEGAAAAAHWRAAGAAPALTRQKFRGVGPSLPVLLLVSARGGNVPLTDWIDARGFDLIVVQADLLRPGQEMPPHALVVNAIGDADLCGAALRAARAVLARTDAPVINPADRVLATGRMDNARRLGRLPGVVAPPMRAVRRAEIARAGLAYPLLLRSPGHHTGAHFELVADARGLPAALARLPGAVLLAIGFLDARGADGLVRKYRVMLIDGALYPVHLAIGRHWKLHYLSADMADNAAHRAEEARFLDDMGAVLGPRAIAALGGIGAALGLDYVGVDFALDADGALLLFEANATMAVVQPDADPIWDYRRAAVAAVWQARAAMLWRRLADPARRRREAAA